MVGMENTSGLTPSPIRGQDKWQVTVSPPPIVFSNFYSYVNQWLRFQLVYPPTVLILILRMDTVRCQNAIGNGLFCSKNFHSGRSYKTLKYFNFEYNFSDRLQRMCCLQKVRNYIDHVHPEELFLRT